MSAAPVFKTPLCPRCRYDQSGDVLRWTESCPIEGICPECGLQFDWCDLFREPLIPEWWIERDSGRLLSRAVRTLFRSLRLLSFWKRIRLEFDGRLRNSIYLLFFLLGCFYISEVAMTAATLYDIYVKTRVYMPTHPPGLGLALFPFTTGARPNLLWLLFYAACFPLAAILLPQTRHRAKVAWSHLFRVCIYTTAAALTIQMLFSAIAVALVLIENTISGWRNASLFPMHYWTQRVVIVSVLIFPPVVTFSWWSACRSYLRLQHATGVAIALAIISALLTLTTIVSIEVVRHFGLRGAFFSP